MNSNIWMQTGKKWREFRDRLGNIVVTLLSSVQMQLLRIFFAITKKAQIETVGKSALEPPHMKRIMQTGNLIALSEFSALSLFLLMSSTHLKMGYVRFMRVICLLR